MEEEPRKEVTPSSSTGLLDSDRSIQNSIIMKKIPIVIGLFATITTAAIISSCATTSDMAALKSGAQLWGENCLRCHNAPSPETFSDTEWDVAIMHMRVRANLTEDEAVKIAEFLKTAN